MPNYREQLQTLLRELFQFDSADLDFGIYRVMNQRRAEIEQFIQSGLLDAVAQELKLLDTDAANEKSAALEKVANEVRTAYGDNAIGADGNIIAQFSQLPLALRYSVKKAEVETATASADAERDVFNHLYTFFSRYYDDGDFISARRYSREPKYAIPYNGEEVLLHWANRDQYYVKTADVLTEYAFLVGAHNEYRVRFQIVHADTEQGNVKGDNRYFFSAPRDVAAYDDTKQELTVNFEYRPLTDKEKETFGNKNVQTKIIEASRDRLLKAIPDPNLKMQLAHTPREDDPRSVLELQLARWTRKSTSDFFIHKDLRGFLNRELDFYIKNELMRLDNIEDADAPRVESYLTRVKVIKRIARTIIDFLAQTEDFQKKLFEKPKFVLESQWCVTLDRVPQELHAQIDANEKQWQEWERLFGVKKPKGNAKKSSEFFPAHPTLTVDTALYDAAFKDALLAALSARAGGLAAQLNGLLIHGENFQALKLLQEAFRERVTVIHIDPPYNTQTSGFLYKNDYQHSSWLAMMEDRIQLGFALLSRDGSFLCHIDENEYERLQLLFERFSVPNAGTVVWDKRNPMNAGRGVATQHEYIAWRSKQETPIYLQNDSILSMINAAAEIIRKYGGVTEKAQKEYAALVSNNSNLSGGEKAHRFLDEQGRIYQSVSLRAPEPRTDRKFHKPLIHPVTRKPCPVPPNGFSRTPETLQAMIGRGEIIFGSDETTQPRQKVLLTEESKRQIGSVIQDARKGKADLDSLGLDFPYCHPVSLYAKLVGAATRSFGDIILDFFPGSGTTAHAVINLNREDSGNRKYILIEQGACFDTVMKPRVQKVIYAAEWKDGKPVEGTQGSSHCFQYLRLESYEDTLDNLELEKPRASLQMTLPEDNDEYLLRYFLDHETRAARLNIAAFASPFDYALRMRRNGVETRVNIDLVETANFLLGLTVTARRAFQHQGRAYRVIQGTANDETVAVIWRNTKMLGLEKEAAFIQNEILAQTQVDRVYINGDSHVPNARAIESVFVNAMR